MPRGRETLVTIVGSAYFEPIATLIEKITSRPQLRTNRIKSGHDENGFSVSAVLLLVAMFESYVSRLRYKQGPSFPNHRKAVDVTLTVFPKLRHKRALWDVYVLRDLLTHGHLWEIDYEWGGSVSMQLLGARLHPAYGDNKYKDRVNMTTHRTKALGLSAFTSRVDRTDAKKLFETIWKTLLVFEAADLNQCGVSHLHVRYRGRNVLFSSLISELTSVT
jgi:hypothetical protein